VCILKYITTSQYPVTWRVVHWVQPAEDKGPLRVLRNILLKVSISINRLK
jgi:hypothetical protein